MTARQEARVGTRAKSGDTWSFETQRAPHIGEILQTARERKGVDLARAERETKIRARHLMALESGDMSALPAAVYAKGFLRNYSTYLGLDADEMIARWRKETDQPGRTEKPRVMPPPQPIATPSRGFKLTSGLMVALVLAAIVFAFVGYVGLQLVRFTQNPALTLTGPAIRQLQPGSEFIQLSGTSDVAAVINATGTDTATSEQIVRSATADDAGAWTVSLPVSKGENHFTVMATDPETARDSTPLEVIVNVPVEDAGIPQGDISPVLPEGVADTNVTGIPSAQLTTTEPQAGLRTRNGRVDVVGTTDAGSVTVSFQWRGNVDAEKASPPSAVLPVKEGVFRGTFQLPKGRWYVSVAAAIDGGYPAISQVPVKSLNDKMVVKVEAIDGKTRVRLTDASGNVIDSKVLLKPGQKKVWRVDPEVDVRVGNAKAANLTVDGVAYGVMGDKAVPTEWQIKQGQKPKIIH